MKLSDFNKNKVIVAVSYLYIILFVYASISKLLDFENFQIQLGQSPILSAYAGVVSIAVIVFELVLAGLLLFKRTRLIGFYGSFSLMVCFTVYIFLILNYSEFIPCSCGGVLEKLGWTEHLIFNIAFIVLAFLAIILIQENNTTSILKNVITRILSLALISCGLVVVMFFNSEHIIKKENNFTRRFKPGALSEKAVFDLKVNSYYFAGFHNGEIYLGNVTAPFLLTRIDTSLLQSSSQLIYPDNAKHKFQNIRMQVKHPYIFVYDGNIPVIFRCSLNDTIAKTISFRDAYFNALQPVDSVRFLIRTKSAVTHQNVLGILKINGKAKVDLKYDLLKTKRDGIFDTDGQFISDSQGNEFVYVHYYKNEYLVVDAELNLKHKFKTIDTISKPQIQIKSSNGKHQMSAPPLTVNKNSILYREVMFNESNLKGRHESTDLWENAIIIDMYSTVEQNYLGSFFIEHRGTNKVTQMMATDRNLFVLSGNEIIKYRFAQSVRNNFRKEEAENPLTE